MNNAVLTAISYIEARPYGDKDPVRYLIPLHIARACLVLFVHNEKIESIRLMRAALSDIGLKEAKDIVESLHTVNDTLNLSLVNRCADYTHPDTEADGFVFCGKCGQRR